ncbi:MAG: endopeptidase La [Candidatus Cloacimonetes bacterium]|nr:endopeptidase La [Candidatus Cloacimonadota bacterium]MCF7814190.1 endopeptidase La [Candidatus Cloacimonadota bacterium]MCF7868861.1 endopeptidase La [Candidatus Cloacimonadota bacterium]MCF7884246.1 endopeptidase La [Candidatus Cloacimonadota bacterium]
MAEKEKGFIINDKNYGLLPVVPLRNALVLPFTISPLLVGRKNSLNAVDAALALERKIICVSQKQPSNYDEDPKAKDLYRYGTLCTVLQHLKLPDGNMRLLVEGDKRVKIERYYRTSDYLNAYFNIIPKTDSQKEIEMEALFRSFKKSFQEYVNLNKSIPEEALLPLNDTTNPREFFYYSLANIILDIKTKQQMFEIDDLFESISKIYKKTLEEIQILKLENKIDGTVKTRLNKLQREYYLTEQLKAIHKELGVTKEEKTDLLDFQEKIKKAKLSPDARKKAEDELKKFSRLNNFSPEYSVIHTYLTWILDLPWDDPKYKEFNLKTARKILDEDHYGLEKVKDRILEYLAVVKLAKKVKGQILCFVGPPGVGKTSLGKSIARAMDRKFVRLSLGGVRDEAEIRGHRRTYVGALPGVIIQSMKKAETRNPLIMMDEIDKMSRDFRGDPASALLEVLDPEQNDTFRDHYLDFEYDLSQVIFITTANTLNSIPQPLIDRMEVIELPGYTAFEKINIATKHLVPKVLKEHDLKGKLNIKYQKTALEKIIKLYTREAGVRNLERQIAKILRKVVKKFVEGDSKKRVSVKAAELEDYLGIPKHLYSEVNRKDAAGVVTGLAWTQYGGETLQIEAVKVKGSGKLKLTGKLGEVMQESAQAAFSYARLHAKKYGINEDFYKNCDLHLHIPEGAIPKDGPSAGVGLVTAIVSVLSGKKVKHDLAMTGEITLSGNVLPIGGLAEKLIAAKRARIKNVIIPQKNEPNLKEIQDEIKKGLNIILVHKVEEVLDYAIK